jgi:NADPH:quinone reductase-like Zn-dependent oxidoreductase
MRDVPTPVAKDHEVLIRVRAASINYPDWSLLRGKPFLIRLMTGGVREPKHSILGADIAGQVEAVGAQVRQFEPGDEVFGDISECGFGGFAEYVSVPESVLAPKPSGVTVEQAAAAPMTAVVAWQGLRKGGIQPGQKVLINGASGGIGTFSVQIAKALGAEVTGVCSGRNVELVRSIGADHVIDYTQEDFAAGEECYDLILGTAGYRSIFDYSRALCPGGTYVATGGALRQVFEPMLLGPWISMTRKQTVGNLSAKPDQQDLLTVKELMEGGKVASVIDRTYPLGDLAPALSYYGEGHTRGKVVITM